MQQAIIPSDPTAICDISELFFLATLGSSLDVPNVRTFCFAQGLFSSSGRPGWWTGEPGTPSNPPVDPRAEVMGGEKVRPAVAMDFQLSPGQLVKKEIRSPTMKPDMS